jgi:hypothetical protein
MTINNEQLLNIANTIRSQIHPTILMCSASRNFGAIENEKGLYGLQFNISNTSKYKFATVRILLNGSDLYDIEIKNVRGRIVDTKKDIYNDQLNEILEAMWEKKETLKRWDNEIPSFKITHTSNQQRKA